MSDKHIHARDCADQAAASADRNRHDAAAKKREARQQELARAIWLEWYPRTTPHKRTVGRAKT
jgi:hypothetical protein